MIVALAVCGVLLVVLVVAGDRVPNWFLQAGLYTVAVAIVYSFAFSGDQLYGWDIQQEFDAFSTTMQADAWHELVDGDAYRAMLSITALPTVLARLTGISGVAMFRGVYPLLFASFPVLVYVVAGRWLSRAAAFAAAAFVIVQLAFAQQLPAIARQEIALVVFGVLVAVASDDQLPLGYRRVAALSAGSALAFIHYSTAYVTSLVLLVAWVVGGVVALANRRMHRPRVFALPVVLGILGFTVVWNFGVTQSSENVLKFTQQVAERGPEFLPGGQDRSIVDRWLTGNTPQRISGEDYALRVEQIYAATAPWLNGYTDDEVAAYPVTDARPPQVAGLVPEARNVHSTLLVFVSQGYLAITSLGILVFAWRRRRERSGAHEMAIVGVVMLVFVAMMRVSGVAAEAYNQERAQIHASAVLSIGFAAVVAWLLSRWRHVTLVVLGGAVAVVFLASSGLAARLGGGASPANVVDAGDARERFSVTDAEVATAEWLAAKRHPDSLVYTDRYGKLRIWAAAVPIGGASLQDAVTPGTLDRNAYVFASESNIAGGRAGRDRRRLCRLRVPPGVPRRQQGRHLLDGQHRRLPMMITTADRPASRSRDLKVSVVVISKDEPALADTLDALAPSRESLLDEVVVVDASDGRLDAVREAHPWVMWIAYVRRPGAGVTIPEQRNLGVVAAIGDVIVFTDCGCVPAADWLDRLLAPILDDGEQVTCGRTGSKRASLYDGIPPGSSPESPPDYVDECPTINMAFRRSAFVDVGGFDESFDYGSDIDFSWRLSQAGIRIRYVPDAVVVHEWGDPARQRRRAVQYGRARARLYRKHPDRLPHMLRHDPIVAAYPLFLLGLPADSEVALVPGSARCAALAQPRQAARPSGSRPPLVRHRCAAGVGRRRHPPSARVAANDAVRARSRCSSFPARRIPTRVTSTARWPRRGRSSSATSMVAPRLRR